MIVTMMPVTINERFKTKFIFWIEELSEIGVLLVLIGWEYHANINPMRAEQKFGTLTCLGTKLKFRIKIVLMLKVWKRDIKNCIDEVFSRKFFSGK